MTTPIKFIEHEASFARSASEDVAPGDLLREFLRALWARKGMITMMLIVALLFAFAAIVLIPPRYTATAMIEVNFRTDQVAAGAKTDITASLDAAALVASAVQIISSRANASAVVTRLQLDRDPAFTHQPFVRSLISDMRTTLGLDETKAAPSLSSHELAVNTLMQYVTVASETRSYVISIAANWDDPATATRLANTMALEYLRTRAMQQIADARSAGTRELAELLSAYGVRHPNYTRALAKIQDLDTRMAALSDHLSIEEVGAIAVGQSLIPADKVLMPTSPDPKMFVGMMVGAALLAGMLLAWRSRDRQTEASAAVLERYQHSERAMVTTLAEMYVQGGLRKGKAIAEDQSGPSFSAFAISAINDRLDESLALCTRRPLQDRFAYLFLDERHEKLREAGAVVSKAVMIAVGIDWDGRPQIIGVEMASGESDSGWKDFLLGLKSRGLRGVELVVSTHHDGLVAAIAEVLPEAAWQRCNMHFLREAASYLPRNHSADCLPELGLIYECGDLALARADVAAWLAKWTPSYPRLTAWVDENIERTLTFFRSPLPHHKYVSSTKLLEPLNEEIRLRSEMVRVFPNAESCLRLIRALAVEAHENWIAANSRLDMDDLRGQKKLAIRQAA